MKLDALDHPKTWELIGHLKVSRPTALGHLELFWHFVAKHAPRGNVGRFPDAAIARGCDWTGDPEQFVKGLLKSGFLDASEEHRFLVHDWPEHCPNWVRAQLSKLKTPFFSTVAGSEEPSYEASTRARVPREGKGSQGRGSQAKPGEGKGDESAHRSVTDGNPNGCSSITGEERGVGEDLSGQSAPPEEPTPRNGNASKELRSGERRNGDFELILNDVEKLVLEGGYVAADTRGIARGLHISVSQAETAIRQLRDRGRLPGVAA